ncbi:MAG: hypothetical protein Q9217_005605 [Psora testacea]
MKLDAAILRSLSLEPAKTTVASHGGSGFTTTAKITTTLNDGTRKHFFLKTGQGEDAEVMFAGEHASLNAIHTIPSLCPQSFAHGKMDNGGAFLVTDFIDIVSSRSSLRDEQGSGLSLAQKLAKLHTTPASIPEGYDRPMFGFPISTCCGNTEQENDFTESWADFYARHRLLAILRKSEKTNGKDTQLRSLVEKTAKEVVPRLIGDDHLNNGKGVTPVVVHGDLWSGNKGRGRIGGKGAVEDVVFDPSAAYAHGEYELGIMRMFGGFGESFLTEYHSICPKTEPVEEYEDRVSLYELYHHLNHHAIFGGGYKSGAISIMRDLHRKYGNSIFLDDLTHVKKTLEAASGHPFYFLSQIEDPTYIYIVGSWPSAENHWQFLPSRANQELLTLMKGSVEVMWMLHIDSSGPMQALPKESAETVLGAEYVAPSVGKIVDEAPVISISRYFISSGKRSPSMAQKDFIETFRKAEHHLKAHQAPYDLVLGQRIETTSRDMVEVITIAGWNHVAQHLSFADTPGYQEFAKIKEFVDATEIKHAKKLAL